MNSTKILHIFKPYKTASLHNRYVIVERDPSIEQNKYYERQTNWEEYVPWLEVSDDNFSGKKLNKWDYQNPENSCTYKVIYSKIMRLIPTYKNIYQRVWCQFVAENLSQILCIDSLFMSDILYEMVGSPLQMVVEYDTEWYFACNKLTDYGFALQYNIFVDKILELTAIAIQKYQVPKKQIQLIPYVKWRYHHITKIYYVYTAIYYLGTEIEDTGLGTLEETNNVQLVKVQRDKYKTEGIWELLNNPIRFV